MRHEDPASASPGRSFEVWFPVGIGAHQSYQALARM
jgi:hypothetical protein